MRATFLLLLAASGCLLAAAPVASADVSVLAVDGNGDGYCSDAETVWVPFPGPDRPLASCLTFA